MIVLPWPSSALSGHQNQHWRPHRAEVTKHRAWAKAATMEAEACAPDGDGDIPIHFAFTPPDNRGDRTNFPNRIKPYIDGIADALKVNDRRFLPSYVFNVPKKPGQVVVTIGQAA